MDPVSYLCASAGCTHVACLSRRALVAHDRYEAWRRWGLKARDRLPDDAGAAVYASSQFASVCATVTDVGTDYGQVYGWRIVLSSDGGEPAATDVRIEERHGFLPAQAGFAAV